MPAHPSTTTVPGIPSTQQTTTDGHPPQPGQHILDLACGTGLVTLLAKRASGTTGTVTGVDISTSMMAVGIEKAAKEKLNPMARVGHL